jgi:membrane dipeptidase
MLRRSFLKAGLGGAALVAAAAACGGPSPQPTGQPIRQDNDDERDLSVEVIGADGSQLTSAVVDKYLAAGVTVWHYLPNLPEFAKVDAFLASDKRIILARTYADILNAEAAGKVAMVVGWQDSAALEQGSGNEWRTSSPPTTKLRDYYDQGLRSANLCYNLANSFGGGCLDPTVPLTRAGRFLIGQMQDMGVLVDTGGHTGEQTSLDVIAMAKRPVVCSHANMRGLTDNPRNISDRVIAGIAGTGGLVGITAVSACMTWSAKDAPQAMTGPFPPRANLTRYVDEFDYMKKLVGIDHVGLGTDFVTDVFVVNPSTMWEYPPEMAYLQADGLQYVDRWTSVSDLPGLRAEFVRRGYSDLDIAKIFGGNWMRVFRESWN